MSATITLPNRTSNIQETHQKYDDANFPWYSEETGIYSSKHVNIKLPQNPFLDVVTHIFSYPNNNHNHPALIDYSSGYSIPYSQLFSLVKSMSFGLHDIGFSQGDVALILLPNSVYFPVILMGVLYLGGIITPMNPLSSFSEVKHQILSSCPSIAFCHPENSAKLRGLGLKAIEVPETNQSCDFYRLVYGNVGKTIVRPKINQDDTATILYSSGTTGASKGVLLTHRNLISMVELFVRFEASQYQEKMDCRQNVYLDVVPMYHIYGLALFGLGLLSLGTSVVVMKKYDINAIVKAIERYKVTHFPAVPPIMAALSMKARSLTDKSGLRSLKQVSCAASTITNKVIEDFLHNFPGVDFIQGYGMTESTAVGTRGFNMENAHKYTSVGLLAPNMEAKVIDLSTGSSLPPGKVGELLLRGPGVMKGYLNNSEATRLTIEHDGWLHTGDISYFDLDGYLYIVDRLKEIIKYNGFQIAPADLETVLMSHPEILDVAVTAAPNEEAGEIPVAFVVKKPGSMLSRDEVINYVAKEVAPYKKVREVMFVSSIPKSAAGKVLRRQLRNLLNSKL